MSPAASRFGRGLALLLALQLVLAGAAGAARRKRFVAFRQGSTFFYRLNYKVTTFPYTTIFSHASGFKVGWQLPTSKTQQQQQQQQARALSARDLRDSAELVLESHGFNGKMCLLKSLCQVMEQIQGKDGVLIKILNLLLGSGSSGNETSATLGLDPLVCGNYANHCPLHLIGFNAFTEY